MSQSQRAAKQQQAIEEAVKREVADAMEAMRANMAKEALDAAHDHLTQISEAAIDDRIHTYAHNLLHRLGVDYDTRPTLTEFAGNHSIRDAQELARAALLAYSDQHGIEWEVERSGHPKPLWVRNDDNATQFYVVTSDSHMWIVFRGTEEGLNIRTNLGVAKELLWKDGENEFKVHGGFLRAFRSVWSELSAFIDQQNLEGQREIWVTGHSLGGALATLAAVEIERSEMPSHRLGGVCTFGQPRVGNRPFARWLDVTLGARCRRFVNGGDPVPLIPILFYQHSRTQHFFSSLGTIERPPTALGKWVLVLRHLIGYVIEKLLVRHISFILPLQSDRSLIEYHSCARYVSHLDNYTDPAAFGILRKISTWLALSLERVAIGGLVVLVVFIVGWLLTFGISEVHSLFLDTQRW